MTRRRRSLLRQLPAVLRESRSTPTLVLLSQVYVPDPAAVGQYLHEVAAAMAARGARVVVFAPDHGYDDPTQRYARYECIDGVHIVRLPFSSFGKSSLTWRLAGGVIFTCEAALLAASLPRVDAVLVSTSPPMGALAAVTVSQLRSAPLSYWVMDINPDLIVATGQLSPSSLAVSSMDWLNRLTLRHAANVFTLDEYMAERLRRKHAAIAKLRVVPPWPLFEPSAPDPRAIAEWRRKHGLSDKRVVMYSGNFSRVHSLDTVLRAALELRADPRLHFVFIGGGLGLEEMIELTHANALTNVTFLPYQPRETLPTSLGAADLHLVSMGDDIVGIVHPSKIYSAIAAGRPIMALAPPRSHIAEMVHRHRIGWLIERGDVSGAVAALDAFARLTHDELEALNERAREAARAHYDRASLLAQFCDWLDSEHIFTAP